MLSNQSNQTKGDRILLTFSRGRIVRKTAEGEQYFSTLDAKLQRIESSETRIEGRGTVEFWRLIMEDGGEQYDVSIRKHTGTATAVLQALANVPNLSRETGISFEVYQSGRYTNVNTHADGNRVQWNTAAVPVLSEPTRRAAYFEKVVADLNAKLSTNQ